MPHRSDRCPGRMLQRAKRVALRRWLPSSGRQRHRSRGRPHRPWGPPPPPRARLGPPRRPTSAGLEKTSACFGGRCIPAGP
eukprot:scaffold78794_cov35-Prasinocladus_malaysianus.AAC.2